MLNLARLLLIVCVAFVVAAGNAMLNPDRPPWSEETLQEGEIRLADVVASKESILWLDARSQGDYSQAHIPRALLLNGEEWDVLLPEVLAVWSPGQRIVVYCSSHTCQASHDVAKRLRSEVGIPDVWVLKGGWEAWQTRQK